MTRCTWCRRTFTENEWVGHLTVRCWEHQKQPQWTTTPPTEPGWYWVWPRADGLIGSALFVHKLGNREIVLGEFHFDNGLSAPLRNAAAWQRIDPPEVPK